MIFKKRRKETGDIFIGSGVRTQLPLEHVSINARDAVGYQSPINGFYKPAEVEQPRCAMRVGIMSDFF